VGLPIVLYVRASVSLSLPQELPARVLRTLFLACNLFLTFVACRLNVNSGSNVTPRIFGFLLIGTGVLSMWMSNGVLTSFVQSVKSVADDFPGESSSFCSFSHSLTVWR